MYGKLFESIYDGTLVEDWRALITFQQMIILCDSDGVLDITIPAMARRTGIPIEHIRHGVKILESPDPSSRTPNEKGKRIIRIDEHREWGWVIVNHKHYRDLRTSSDRREYMRNYMAKKRACKKELTNINKSLQLTVLANTDTDTDANTDTDTKIKPRRFSAPSIDDVSSYCLSRDNKINPQEFIDHYEANGWMRGKTKIKNWKACVRTWENKRKGGNNGQNQSKPKSKEFFDTLDELAKKDIEERGFTNSLGD